MASKKQKTSYASKLKEDPDLSYPLHDDIQMWAMKNKTALYSKLLSMTTTDLSWFDDRKKAYLVKNLSCQVEYPVKSHLVSGGFGKSIVGFPEGPSHRASTSTDRQEAKLAVCWPAVPGGPDQTGATGV